MIVFIRRSWIADLREQRWVSVHPHEVCFT
jgi:hypothetical protein